MFSIISSRKVFLRCLFAAIVFLLSAFELSAPAFAGSGPPDVNEQHDAAALAIVEDNDAKAFSFLIDGNEIARLDADGLHVRGSIEYGGSIVDVGAGSASNPGSETSHAPEGAPDKDAP